MRAQMPIGRLKPATSVNPLTFFPAGGGTADGWVYDLNDLTTVFKDQEGTPAAANDDIAMLWSLAHPWTLGANIVTNGDFPTTTTGWTGVSATLTVNAAHLRVTNSGAAAGRAYQSLTTEVGKLYKVTVDLVTNANGAAIAVGISNSTSTLYLRTLASSTTGSYTFYFLASTTASFLQLRTTSTTSGHFTEWDNVVCKKVGDGNHCVQPVAANRPKFRQHASGFYYMENDDGTKWIQGGLNFTAQNPCYSCFSIIRTELANGTGYYSVGKSSVAYHRFGSATLNRVAVSLRDAAGSGTINSTNNTWPDGAKAVIDALIASAGAHDLVHNRRNPVTGTLATGFAGNTLSGPCFYCNAGGGGSGNGTGGKISRVITMNQDPGASRAGLRIWAAAGNGAD